MSALTDLASDERHARMLLSLLAEHDDLVTGCLPRQAGADETLRLLDGSGAVPGLSRVDSRVWRNRLSLPARPGELADRLSNVERSGITALTESTLPVNSRAGSARPELASEFRRREGPRTDMATP